MSDNKRLVIAAVLSAALLLVWSIISPPPKRAVGDANAPVSRLSGFESASETGTEQAHIAPESAPERGALPPLSGISETEVVLQNPQIRVVLSNRGARVRADHM